MGPERLPLVMSRVSLQTAKSEAKPTPASSAVDPATGPDVQGCWQARFGEHTLTWQIILPEHLPSTFHSRLGKIHYQIVAGIDVLHKHRKVTLTTSCDMDVCELLSKQAVLAQLLTTPIVDEHAWMRYQSMLLFGSSNFRWSPKTFNQHWQNLAISRDASLMDGIRLRASVNRSVWMAGTMCYVDVDIKANEIERVSVVKLTLQQVVCTFHADDVHKDEPLRQTTVSLVVSAYRRHQLFGSAPEDTKAGWHTRTLGIRLPAAMRSVQQASRLSVVCILKVTLVLSWSSVLVVRLPIIVMHPASFTAISAKSTESSSSSSSSSLSSSASNRHFFSSSNTCQSVGTSPVEPTLPSTRLPDAIIHRPNTAGQDDHSVVETPVPSDPRPPGSDRAPIVNHTTSHKQRYFSLPNADEMHREAHPPRPQPLSDDPMLDALISRQRACDQHHRVISPTGDLDDESSCPAFARHQARLTRGQLGIAADSHLEIATGRTTWHKRFSVDEVGKPLEQVIMEARRNSHSPIMCHRRGHSSGQADGHLTSRDDSITHRRVLSSDRNLDTVPNEINTQLDDSCAFSFEVHRGIRDSIAVESRDWDDILGRLNLLHDAPSPLMSRPRPSMSDHRHLPSSTGQQRDVWPLASVNPAPDSLSHRVTPPDAYTHHASDPAVVVAVNGQNLRRHDDPGIEPAPDTTQAQSNQKLSSQNPSLVLAPTSPQPSKRTRLTHVSPLPSTGRPLKPQSATGKEPTPGGPARRAYSTRLFQDMSELLRIWRRKNPSSDPSRSTITGRRRFLLRLFTTHRRLSRRRGRVQRNTRSFNQGRATTLAARGQVGPGTLSASTTRALKGRLSTRPSQRTMSPNDSTNPRRHRGHSTMLSATARHGSETEADRGQPDDADVSLEPPQKTERLTQIMYEITRELVEADRVAGL